MSTYKTPQYQLHRWEPGDSFVREEFNENFTKLDAALVALRDTPGDLVAGRVYVAFDSVTVYLGFAPSMVMYVSGNGAAVLSISDASLSSSGFVMPAGGPGNAYRYYVACR